MGAIRPRQLVNLLVACAFTATVCMSCCHGAKEELEYAILNEETGEMHQAKIMSSGTTTDSQDCILVHHTGCTSKARWKCVTCDSGDHVYADPFTSCHVSFEPLEGASLVRLTCKAVKHLTEGVSTLVNTGYYPKHFPVALRKCTWPHENVPPKRPDRLTMCNETQKLYEGLRRGRMLDADPCSPDTTDMCRNKPCEGTGGTAGQTCGCTGLCCFTGKKNTGCECRSPQLPDGGYGKCGCYPTGSPGAPDCSKQTPDKFGDGCNGTCGNDEMCHALKCQRVVDAGQARCSCYSPVKT